MNRIQSTAARAYHSLLASQPNTAAKVAFAWQVAAGPALARAGRPRWTDGTLLTELLGADVVRRLVIE